MVVPELATEIMGLIAQEYLAIWSVTDDPQAAELISLTSITPGFHAVLQPFLFRHVNISSLQQGIELLKIFEYHYRGYTLNLAGAVRTLQMDFDLKGTDPEHEKYLAHFWVRWRFCVKAMRHLNTITLCVNMRGVHNCLKHFLSESRVEEIASLCTFHITPSQDHWPRYDEGALHADRGPWDAPGWDKLLSSPALNRLTALVLTTPGYPFWPPTPNGADTMFEKWFSELDKGSNLRKVVLHFGYFDEADRHVSNISSSQEQLDENNTIWPPHLQASWFSPCVVWERASLIQPWAITQGDVYCGTGQHRYFHAQEGRETIPCRVYGYEDQLKDRWPYDWN
ncbi:hypothetical protein C8R45DRAFT_983505 [Mycena sanguinolenta]|nr:hypothetical protein C8R45DRAFT_983505 [Mycena sanguinolenta]